MNEQPAGREGDFLGGARANEFRSVQQGAGHDGFRPISVLDESHLLTPANGMSVADRSRQPLKGPGMSINGQSSTTFDKRMWLGSGYRTFGN